MKNLTLEIIAQVCRGVYFGKDEDRIKSPEGVVLDSRKVEPDFLFIATKGERTDGHHFIDKVFSQGALCALGEDEPKDYAGAYIRVADSFQALKDIAEYYRKQLNVTVIGISGSVGKTTTKEFVASVLSQKYKVLKTEGNFNNEVGLPLTVLRLREEHEAAVLEMGISHFGEMHRLSKIACPDICVLTNIGQCHLEFLGSREGILKAKTEMFDFMSSDGRVCVNGDDDILGTIQKVKNEKPLSFGIESSNDIYAADIADRGLLGSSVNIHMKDDEFHVDIPLPGIHMVYNALCAASVGKLLGLSSLEIAQGISGVCAVDGRSHVIRSGGLTIIDDCYNANPVSMKAAIDLLSTAEGKKTAVLGDMYELGMGELAMHEEVGAYAVQKELDRLICIGELSQSMFVKAWKQKHKANSGIELQYYGKLEEFLGKCREILQEGETVLVKASHGMHFEKIISLLRT